MTIAAAATAGLNERIGDFAGLVGLVLVLITLFTNQRQGALRELEDSVPDARAPHTREIWIDMALVVVTTLLFLTGLPVVIDAVEALHPLADDGQLPVAFVIVWFLLLALIAWQVSLVFDARRARTRWMDDKNWSTATHWWKRRKAPT